MRATFLAASIVVASACLTVAQTPTAPAPAQPKPAEHATESMPPLPPDAHVEQSIQLNGRALKYTATVGTIPVYARDGKKSADVVFTSYVVDTCSTAGRRAARRSRRTSRRCSRSTWR